MSTGRRFQDYDKKLSPGPGYYNETGNVAAGAQVCTNFHSTLTKNLGTTEARTQWGGNPRFRTPGPGTYRPPSDFGYLDFKNTLRGEGGNGSVLVDTSIMGDSTMPANKFDISIQSDSKRNRNNVSSSLQRPLTQSPLPCLELQNSGDLSATFEQKRPLGQEKQSPQRQLVLAQRNRVNALLNEQLDTADAKERRAPAHPHGPEFHARLGIHASLPPRDRTSHQDSAGKGTATQSEVQERQKDGQVTSRNDVHLRRRIA